MPTLTQAPVNIENSDSKCYVMTYYLGMKVICYSRKVISIYRKSYESHSNEKNLGPLVIEPPRQGRSRLSFM